MIPASTSTQRSQDAKLLVIDERGAIAHRARADFQTLVRPRDVVVANDAATLPASLVGTHVPTGSIVEVRLAGRDSLLPRDVTRFTAVVFGAGDFRTPTEYRLHPPLLHTGDELRLGPLRAIVLRVLGHPRLIELLFENPVADIWEGLARHGRPIQYAYVTEPLAIWDTWTRIASLPVAFEAPSAGFILDWTVIAALRARGATFATLTHAAGLSSTGDAELDRLLPLDEPYHIPTSTAALIEACRDRGGRVIAIGTTVVRALEHAARADGTVHPGAGTATQRIGPRTRLKCVDAIVSGTHEPGTSHYDLLRAFQDDEVLHRMDREADAHGYRTHEFGDSVWLAQSRSRPIEQETHGHAHGLSSRLVALASNPTAPRLLVVTTQEGHDAHTNAPDVSLHGARSYVGCRRRRHGVRTGGRNLETQPCEIEVSARPGTQEHHIEV